MLKAFDGSSTNLIGEASVPLSDVPHDGQPMGFDLTLQVWKEEPPPATRHPPPARLHAFVRLHTPAHAFARAPWQLAPRVAKKATGTASVAVELTYNPLTRES